MAAEEIPAPVRLPEQVSSLYKTLAGSAVVLNAASDEFTKAVAPLDEALSTLNLGIECWVRVHSYLDDDDGGYTNHELGYARVHRQWGIALRICSGNEHLAEFYGEEKWLFANAPRQNRIDAVQHIPQLLERLTKKADSAAKKIRQTTETAREIADAVAKAKAEVTPPKKGTIPVTPKASGQTTPGPQKSPLPITPRAVVSAAPEPIKPLPGGPDYQRPPAPMTPVGNSRAVTPSKTTGGGSR